MDFNNMNMQVEITEDDVRDIIAGLPNPTLHHIDSVVSIPNDARRVYTIDTADVVDTSVYLPANERWRILVDNRPSIGSTGITNIQDNPHLGGERSRINHYNNDTYTWVNEYNPFAAVDAPTTGVGLREQIDAANIQQYNNLNAERIIEYITHFSLQVKDTSYKRRRGQRVSRCVSDMMTNLTNYGF